MSLSNVGRTGRVCHSWHGFIPCEHDHPVTPNPEPFPAHRGPHNRQESPA